MYSSVEWRSYAEVISRIQGNMIHEFAPRIYPTFVWVGTGIHEREASERFYSLNADGTVSDFKVNEPEYGYSAIATSYPVCDRVSGMKGIFCNILKPRLATPGILAHEAEHIVCWICDRLGIVSVTFDDSEPRAYLLGWIVDCFYGILKTKKK